MQFSKWVTLGFGALCLVAVAGVLNLQHLYYMAAILLTLPGVSYLLGWYTLRGVTFTRELPATAWEGEKGSFLYQATNDTKVPRYFLSAHESLPAWIKPIEPLAPLFNVASGDTVRVPVEMSFQKRGVYQVKGFDVTALDPLGIFAFTKSVECEGELVIFPLPQQMRGMPLSGAERHGFQEFVVQALMGSSVDPDGVRAYSPGDPLRRIHWRQTARTGKLSVIEFEDTQSINLTIALDLMKESNIGKGLNTTLEYAVRLAASAAYQAIEMGAGVRLVVPEYVGAVGESFVKQIPVSMNGRGQQHLYRILDTLARIEANSPIPISEVVEANAQEVRPGTSLLVISSRIDPDLPRAMARYAVPGSKTLFAYIEPNSFEEGRGKVSASDQERFLSELAGARAQVFTFRREADGVLLPEVRSNAKEGFTGTVA